MSLDPRAVKAANQRLWDNHPELKGRQLTMGPEDAAYRKEWMQDYRDAADQSPKPPPPKALPQPVSNPPASAVAGDTTTHCPHDVAHMSSKEKRLRAYEMAKAKLPAEIRKELPDPLTFLAMMGVIGSLTLIAGAATGGVAYVAAGALVGLALVGALVTGWEIGTALNELKDFYDKTRCDQANSPADLDKASDDLANVFAKAAAAGALAVLTEGIGRLAKLGKAAQAAKEAKAAAKEAEAAEQAAKKAASAGPKPPLTGGKYAGKTLEMGGHGKEIDGKYPVKIYNNSELEDFRVVSGDDGKLVYAKSGKPVNSPNGEAIYVMDENGNVYVHESPQFGQVHHSSLAGGKEPAAAGHITATDGKVTGLNEQTGHYGADQPAGNSDVVKQELGGQGVDVSGTKAVQYDK